MLEFVILGLALAVLIFVYRFKNKELKPSKWIWVGHGKDPFKK